MIGQHLDPWEPIDSYDQIIGHGVVLVGRPAYSADQFGPATAFKDVTGVWRVYLSCGGLDRLPFEPTHYMLRPDAPAPDNPAEATPED